MAAVQLSIPVGIIALMLRDGKVSYVQHDGEEWQFHSEYDPRSYVLPRHPGAHDGTEIR